MLYLNMSGWDGVVSIVTCYRLGGSVFKARFFGPVQTGLEAHPASYSLHTGSLFLGVKWPGCGINYPSSLMKSSKKE
jgi:hypothetical protein